MSFRRFSGENFIAHEHVRTGLGSSEEIVFFPALAASFALSAGQIKVLENCLLSGTLAELADRFLLAHGLHESKRQTVLQALGSLTQKGMIVPLSRIFPHRSRARRERGETRITSIAIPTCGRPDLLVRAIRSFAANARAFGRAPRFLVIDDSRLATDRARNRKLLTTLRAETGAQIHYADRIDRMRFGRKLALESGLPVDLVNYGLLGAEKYGSSYGASRNSILIETLGERILSIDDDMTCTALPWIGVTEPGLKITGSPAALMSHWFGSEDELRHALSRPSEVDYLGLHESLLGKDPAALAEEAARTVPAALKLNRMSSSMIRKIRDPNARVALTSTGMIGVSGAPAGALLLFQRGRQRKRFFADPDLLESALREDLQTRSVTQNTLCESGPTMGMNMGIDNRGPLPPFIPNLRGEDDAFGACLRMAIPGALVGHLVGALHHGRSVERRSLESVFQTSLRGSANGCLIDAIESASFGAPDDAPYSDLARLGRHLVEFGRRDPVSFRSERMRADLNFLKYTQRRIEETLQTENVPAHFQNALRDYERVIAAEARSMKHPSLEEAALGEDDDPVPAFQAMATRYGSLLQAWPALVSSTLELNSRGIRLGRAL